MGTSSGSWQDPTATSARASRSLRSDDQAIGLDDASSPQHHHLRGDPGPKDVADQGSAAAHPHGHRGQPQAGVAQQAREEARP
eukprot:3102591-Pyramimonas_sp.AAC.1